MFASGNNLCVNTAIIFYLCCLTCLLIKSTLADCSINLPEDEKSRPILYKYVGSHRLKISPTGKKPVRIKENQKLEANCDLHFNSPSKFKESSKMYMKCIQGYLYMSGDVDVNDQDYYSNWELIMECYYPYLDLYESNSNFEWCAANLTSYNLASMNVWKPEKSPYAILAGICFDIYTNSFNSIYYTLEPYKTEEVQLNIIEYSFNLGLKLEYITETFGSNSISATVFQEHEYQFWANNYNFGSIIQHEKLGNIFNEKYATLLEFMWWPNLRQNNWSLYIKALENHIEKDKTSYDILAGVSGAIKVPVLPACQNKYALQEVIFNTNKRIPQYIWNYLQDRTNKSNQIVIVGMNSPVDEISSQHDIIFCPDKCQEIAWLKETSSSFRFSIMGTIFCCSVQDVRLSGRLDGFPEIDFTVGPTITTELPDDYVVEPTDIYDNWDDN